jgi:inner membrane protein
LDNLTHTLVGILVGESAARAAPARNAGLAPDVRRNAFVALMALGSNIPDLDFIPSSITGNKLEYLLHHRGHTHTILGALIVATLLYLAWELWCRWRKLAPSRVDRLQMAGIAALSTLLHIGLDSTNNYGVHPFWPIDNRWYYGDAVFIVEPSFWAMCAPLVFILRRFAKAFVALALAIGIGLSFVTGMVPTGMAIALTVVTLAMLAVGRWARPQSALAISLIGWLAINAAFAQASATADRRVAAIAEQAFPHDRLLDIVLTPMPVNPACWQVLLVQSDPGVLYVRRATLSLAPSLIAAANCPSRADLAQTTAKFADIPLMSTATVQWHGEVATSLAELRALAEQDCHAAGFVRFARAPWLATDASKRIIGDARYDHEAELGFAELDLNEQAPCMKRVPPWTPPRSDLLDSAPPKTKAPESSGASE